MTVPEKRVSFGMFGIIGEETNLLLALCSAWRASTALDFQSSSFCSPLLLPLAGALSTA